MASNMLTMSEQGALRILTSMERKISKILREPRQRNLRVKLLPAPEGMEEETRLWIIRNLKRLIEIGMRKVAARSTSKSERVRWANTVANASKVLNATVTDVELVRIHKMLEEAKIRAEEEQVPPIHVRLEPGT